MPDARILVVEDNPINMELVTDLLEVAGYEVIPAMTGEDGVAKALAEKPDLILMDIRLPGIDGLEATAQIKSQPSTAHIPIIALTAQAMKEDAVRVKEAGCDGYITKPIDTRSLRDAILSAIDTARGK